MSNPNLLTALALANNGVSVIPCQRDKLPFWSLLPKREDGTATWNPYKGPDGAIAEEAVIRSWFENGNESMIATAGGVVSGNLEILDFDDPPLYHPWCELVESQCPGLIHRLRIQQTPSGGYHITYRCPGVTIPGNQPLARKQRGANGSGKPVIDTLIETRGEGGYALTAPSDGYLLVQGDIADFPVITPEERDILLVTAQSFNETVRKQVTGDTTIVAGEGLRPGSDYDARGEWRTVLESDGWCKSFERGETEYWTRPGKSRGVSATFNASQCPGKLYVFSTNASPFESETSYSPFGVFATLKHNGDFSAAAGDLLDLGYGEITDYLQSDEIHNTDMGNSERLVKKWGASLKYCFAWKRWLVWDEYRWMPDETGAIIQCAKETIRGIHAEVAELEEKGERRRLSKWAFMSEAHSRITSMVSGAQSDLPVTPDELDTDTWLLNVRNGTLNLRTKEFRGHQSDDLITKLADVEYEPVADCPVWEAFLDRIMGGDKELISFLQRAAGYALTGDTSEQCMFILYGTGANGKTTFLQALSDAMGDYARQTPTDTLLVKRGDTIPNDVARLKGARLVTAAEADEGRRLAESLVKQMTGGDKLSARFLHGEFFDFAPTFKIFLATNHKPTIKGTDHAIWRRIRLIPFAVEIPEEEQDRELADKLREELTGILAWAVRGCYDWQENGLGMPAEVKNATAAYRDEMDVVGEFMSECTYEPKPGTDPTEAAGVTVKANDLYKEYQEWCEDAGERAVTRTSFGRKLTERGYEKKRMTTGIVYICLGLESEETDQRRMRV